MANYLYPLSGNANSGLFREFQHHERKARAKHYERKGNRPESGSSRTRQLNETSSRGNRQTAFDHAHPKQWKTREYRSEEEQATFERARQLHQSGMYYEPTIQPLHTTGYADLKSNEQSIMLSEKGFNSTINPHSLNRSLGGNNSTYLAQSGGNTSSYFGGGQGGISPIPGQHFSKSPTTRSGNNSPYRSNPSSPKRNMSSPVRYSNNGSPRNAGHAAIPSPHAFGARNVNNFGNHNSTDQSINHLNRSVALGDRSLSMSASLNQTNGYVNVSRSVLHAPRDRGPSYSASNRGALGPSGPAIPSISRPQSRGSPPKPQTRATSILLSNTSMMQRERQGSPNRTRDMSAGSPMGGYDGRHDLSMNSTYDPRNDQVNRSQGDLLHTTRHTGAHATIVSSGYNRAPIGNRQIKAHHPMPMARGQHDYHASEPAHFDDDWSTFNQRPATQY